MGSIFDPEKTVEENKEDAMRDAGHSPFSLEKKVSSKQLLELLDSYLQGTRDIPTKKIIACLKKAIKQEKISKRAIKFRLTQHEKALTKKNLQLSNSLKYSKERIKHIKNIL